MKIVDIIFSLPVVEKSLSLFFFLLVFITFFRSFSLFLFLLELNRRTFLTLCICVGIFNVIYVWIFLLLSHSFSHTHVPPSLTLSAKVLVTILINRLDKMLLYAMHDEPETRTECAEERKRATGRTKPRIEIVAIFYFCKMFHSQFVFVFFFG